MRVALARGDQHGQPHKSPGIRGRGGPPRAPVAAVVRRQTVDQRVEVRAAVARSGQGCAVSRYSIGRTRIEAVFWVGIGFGDTLALYRAQPRGCAVDPGSRLGNGDRGSVSGSPNHFYCTTLLVVRRGTQVTISGPNTFLPYFPFVI